MKDKKGGIWLAVLPLDKRAHLGAIEKQSGSAKLSFGRSEILREVLGVAPGSVTPFALINDTARRIRVILDAELLRRRTYNPFPASLEFDESDLWAKWKPSFLPPGTIMIVAIVFMVLTVCFFEMIRQLLDFWNSRPMWRSRGITAPPTHLWERRKGGPWSAWVLTDQGLTSPRLSWETAMNSSTIPSKSSAASSRTVIGLLVALGIVGFVLLRPRPGDFVKTSAVVGEWQAVGRSWHIVFRSDKTVGMSSIGSPDSQGMEPGTYSLQPERNVAIKMKNGRSFRAEFRELTPDQFDLIDLNSGAVTAFSRGR